MSSFMQLVGSTEEADKMACVFVVRLSAGERREVEELKRNGGGIRFTVVSLQSPLDGEPKLVEIERTAYTFDGLLELPVEVK